MTAKLRLTVACGDYGIVRALKEGAVTADGSYAFEQGMIARMPALDELFEDTDLGDAGGSDGI